MVLFICTKAHLKENSMKGVVIIQKRVLALIAISLFLAAVIHRMLGYGGSWSIVLFSSSITMLAVIAVWWLRGKLGSPYALAADTRSLVDHLVENKVTSWRAYRNALLTHRYAYIRYLRRIGVVNVKVFPYLTHIDECIENKKALSMELPPRMNGSFASMETAVVIDGFHEE